MITASELERELVKLVGMIRRLSPPLNQRPELFLEQKDELAAFAEGLRDRACGSAPIERAIRAPQVDTGLRAVRQHGRVIPVERRALT